MRTEREGEDLLAEVLERWNQAARPFRPELLAELYTEDAVFFGGLAGHFVGRAAVEGYFAHYLGTLQAMRMTPRDMQVLAPAADIRLAQGFVDFDFTLADGKVTHQMIRASLALARRPEGWRIGLHHFSPPPEQPPIPR